VTSDTAYDEVEVVDTGAEDEVVDSTPAGAESGESAKTKRAKLPEGYITPIAFNTKLQEMLREQGVLKENEEHRPQVIYSYINNKSKNNPFPVVFVDEAGNEYDEKGEGRRPALRVDEHGEPAEAFAWWNEKEERKVTRAANAKEKAAKKAAAPKKDKTPTDAPEADVEEIGTVEEIE
jgi:hypothetical protein